MNEDLSLNQHSPSRTKGWMLKKGKPRKTPGQKSLWEEARVDEREEVHQVAEQFIQAIFVTRGEKSSVPGKGFGKY